MKFYKREKLTKGRLVVAWSQGGVTSKGAQGALQVMKMFWGSNILIVKNRIISVNIVGC